MNWRNIWDFSSSLKIKTFNVRLCLCHLKGSSILLTSSYVHDIPTTQFTDIRFMQSSLEEFSNWKFNICKIGTKRIYHITGTYHLKVFSSRNIYDTWPTIWTQIFKNIPLWLCHLKVLRLACNNIDKFNIFSIYIFHQSSHSEKWQDSSQSHSLHRNSRVEERKLLTSF